MENCSYGSYGIKETSKYINEQTKKSTGSYKSVILVNEFQPVGLINLTVIFVCFTDIGNTVGLGHIDKYI